MFLFDPSYERVLNPPPPFLYPSAIFYPLRAHNTFTHFYAFFSSFLFFTIFTAIQLSIQFTPKRSFSIFFLYTIHYFFSYAFSPVLNLMFLLCSFKFIFLFFSHQLLSSAGRSSFYTTNHGLTLPLYYKPWINLLYRPLSKMSSCKKIAL